MPTKISKICANCGAHFQVWPYRMSTAKFCSRSCREAIQYHLGKNLNCLNCGKPFYTTRARLQRKGILSPKYCSSRCTRLANNAVLVAPKSRARATAKRWNNPFHHQKLAETMRNHWKNLSATDREKRLTNMLKSNFGRQVSAVTRERIRKARLRQIFPSKDTVIERTMQQELTSRGLSFFKHFPILNCCQADVAFPERRIAVFCDGDYWHTRPETREKDLTQEMILSANGWRVLRFWEHEIKANPAACADKVVQALLPVT